MPSPPSKKPTIYFGYGSNLWLHQMRLRCPTSKFLGVARLKHYKWIIYSRGYANIVQLPSSSDGPHDYTREVWGLVYSLEPKDEARLDVNEGVPVAYEKEMIECEFWKDEEEEEEEEEEGEEEKRKKKERRKKAEKVDMLVYINRKVTGEADPKKEYIYRMNMGIKDALEMGVPEGYVRQVMRKYIPEEEEEEEEEEVAMRQALEFRDER